MANRRKMKYFLQRLSKYEPEVFNIGDSDGWIVDHVVDHGIHCHRHGVARQNLMRKYLNARMKTILNINLRGYLLRRNIKADGSQVNFPIIINTGNDKKYSRAFSSSLNDLNTEKRILSCKCSPFLSLPSLNITARSYS